VYIPTQLKCQSCCQTAIPAPTNEIKRKSIFEGQVSMPGFLRCISPWVTKDDLFFCSHTLAVFTCFETSCIMHLNCQRLLAFSGDLLPLHSYPCSALMYIASASTILPWPAYSMSRLLTVSSVDICSVPHAFLCPRSALAFTSNWSYESDARQVGHLCAAPVD
jgi:hypothetical protein